MDANGNIVDPLVAQTYSAHYDCNGQENCEGNDAVEDDDVDNYDDLDEVDDDDDVKDDDEVNCKSTHIDVKKKYPFDNMIINIACP